MSAIPFVYAVPAPIVHARWGVYGVLLRKSVEHDMERKLTIEGLLDQITSQQAQLLEIRVGGSMAGVCVVGPGAGKSLFVYAIAGNDSDSWLECLVEFLSNMAQGLEYSGGVLFCGRPGWQKKLQALGFKTVLITMARG